MLFPISRDPPEGGTVKVLPVCMPERGGFQFLGIPPKGEPRLYLKHCTIKYIRFQFLGIPPKGEPSLYTGNDSRWFMFPISRDPPEGGTRLRLPRPG